MEDLRLLVLAATGAAALFALVGAALRRLSAKPTTRAHTATDAVSGAVWGVAAMVFLGMPYLADTYGSWVTVAFWSAWAAAVAVLTAGFVRRHPSRFAWLWELGRRDRSQP